MRCAAASAVRWLPAQLRWSLKSQLQFLAHLSWECVCCTAPASAAHRRASVSSSAECPQIKQLWGQACSGLVVFCCRGDRSRWVQPFNRVLLCVADSRWQQSQKVLASQSVPGWWQSAPVSRTPAAAQPCRSSQPACMGASESWNFPLQQLCQVIPVLGQHSAICQTDLAAIPSPLRESLSG